MYSGTNDQRGGAGYRRDDGFPPPFYDNRNWPHRLETIFITRLYFFVIFLKYSLYIDTNHNKHLPPSIVTKFILEEEGRDLLTPLSETCESER